MKSADSLVIKKIILPAEHGASIMLGESLVAGLWIGASWKGLVPALAWVLIFLLSQPLKITLKDISNHVFTSRTRTAMGCSVLFGVLAAGSMAWTLALCGPALIMVLAGMMILGFLHFQAVLKGNKKQFSAEMFGALSLGAGAAMIVMASGQSWIRVFVLWGVLAVRAGTSVVYVRERLRQSRGQVHHGDEVANVHLLGLALLGLFVAFHWIKPVIMLAGVLLSARLGLMRAGHQAKPKDVGIQETMMGILFVIILILAF